MQDLSPEDKRAFTLSNYTVFAVTDESVRNFIWVDQDHMQRSHWQKRDNIAVLMK